MDVTIESDAQREVCVVTCDPEYQSDDGDAITRARETLMQEAIANTPPLVVVDLSSTQYFGSAFVGLLFSLRNRVNRLGGRLAACGANEQCQQVLEVTRFAKVCPMFQSRSEAVASVVR